MIAPLEASWQTPPQLIARSDRSFTTDSPMDLAIWLRDVHGFQAIALSKSPAEIQRLRKGAMLVVIYRSGSIVCQGDAWQQLTRLFRPLLVPTAVPTHLDLFGGHRCS